MSQIKRRFDATLKKLLEADEFAPSPSNYRFACKEFVEQDLGMQDIVVGLKEQLKATRTWYDRVWDENKRCFRMKKLTAPDYRARMDALKELISIYGIRFVPKQDTKIDVSVTDVQIIQEIRQKDYKELLGEARRLGVRLPELEA